MDAEPSAHTSCHSGALPLVERLTCHRLHDYILAGMESQPQGVTRYRPASTQLGMTVPWASLPSKF